MAHETPTMEAALREKVGSKYAQRLRREGRMPAVMYGHGEAPTHLSVDADQINHILHEGAHLIEVKLDGKSETCLLKAVQYDYLGDTVVHVDLARIDLSEEVTVWVPVVLTNQDTAPGVQAEGAYLSQPTSDIEVTCRADSIPDEIVVDCGSLGANESITVADLSMPPGVVAETDPATVIVTVSIVTEEEMEELEEAAVETGAEPELVGAEEEEEAEAEQAETGESEKE